VVAVADQLREVLVARDEDRAVAGGAQPGREGADDVVRFVRRAAELRDAEQAAELAAECELALELRRRRVAVLLVRGVDRVPERGRQRLVEGERGVLGARPLEEVAEEAGESVQRVDRLPVAVGHLESDGIPGAEDEIARVDEVDRGPARGHHCVNRWMRACSGLVRGKCASRYSIWSASTRRPFR
jgi:hypothetical protein